MQMVIIGSGTAVPQEGRSASCYLLRSGSGNVVLDLGPGSIWGLLRHAGFSVRDVDVILLSHLHMDHCADLAPLLFALRSRELARSTPLKILGPPGLNDHVKALGRVWRHWIEPAGYDLQIGEREGREDHKEIMLGGLKFRAAPTNHSLFNLAWRIDGPAGPGVLFTGDGEATEEMVALGRSAPHLLVCECSAGPDEVVPGHMNPEQAGELAAMCGSRLLVLSHINPGPDPDTLAALARKQFDGEVVVAEDGMVVDISDGGKLDLDAGTRGRGDAEKG